ncbi:MAG: hypothetical protein ACK4V1_02110 [Burkholderiaceae bacterium]
MKVAEEIRRLGFRRWYERQLVVSHGYLVAAFLALILLLAGIEGMDYLRRSVGFYLLVAVVAAAAGTLMFVAWRRFSVLLARAERFAENAECPQCKAWGKFRVIAAEPTAADDPPEAGTPHWIKVKCSGCGNEWKLG